MDGKMRIRDKENSNNHLLWDEDFELWWLLAQVRHAALQLRAKELKKYSVKARQAAVLFVLHAIGDRATPAEVSRWVTREPHTVSSLLNRMVREGLLTKVKDLDRKNLVRLVLTEKGKQQYSLSLKREAVHDLFSVLSEDERQQLRLYLEKLRDKVFKELGIEQKPPFPVDKVKERY
jgi:DNA-binding MarR family transcriptional regulator